MPTPRTYHTPVVVAASAPHAVPHAVCASTRASALSASLYLSCRPSCTKATVQNLQAPLSLHPFPCQGKRPIKAPWSNSWQEAGMAMQLADTRETNNYGTCIEFCIQINMLFAVKLTDTWSAGLREGARCCMRLLYEAELAVKSMPTTHLHCLSDILLSPDSGLQD